MREVVLYYDSKFTGYNRYQFYDITNHHMIDVDNSDINITINNLWVDYSSFHLDDEFVNPYGNKENNIYTLILWILKRKYFFICPIRDIKEDNELYKKFIESKKVII